MTKQLTNSISGIHQNRQNWLRSSIQIQSNWHDVSKNCPAVSFTKKFDLVFRPCLFCCVSVVSTLLETFYFLLVKNETFFLDASIPMLLYAKRRSIFYKKF